MSYQKRRDVICVCGVTGSGKTTWAHHFTKAVRRLFVYDLATSFPVQYFDGHTIAERTRNKEFESGDFRVGVYSPYDTDVLTAAAYISGSCLLVLEEISTLFNIGARIHGPLQEVVLLGRQRDVSIMAIAQRASYIPITLRSQASRVITFRQQEPADIKWLEDFMPKRGAEISVLPDLHCLDWDKGNITTYSIPPMSGNSPGTDTHSDTHSPEDCDSDQ